MPSSSARLRCSPEQAFLAGAALYLLLAFLSFCVVRPATLLYFTDYWEHRAIVLEVIRHGTALVDPIYGEAATSRQFTPWSLFMGYLARTTGMSADNALATGAMLVSVVFLLGVRDFARVYYSHRWAPAVLLAVLCCGWGLLPLMWTGFYSLRSQLHSGYYPATVVFALTFVAWAQVLRLLRAPTFSPLSAIFLAVIVAISVITHPLNASILVAAACALILFDPAVPLVRRAIVFAVIAVGIGVTVAWPYFNPLALGGVGLAREKDTFNDFVFFYWPSFIFAQGWPALLMVPFVANQWRRPRYRVGVVAFAAMTIVFLIGHVFHVSVTHRLLAYIFLTMHLVIVRGLLDQIAPVDADALRLPPTTRTVIAALGALLVVWQVWLGVEQVTDPWSRSHYPYPLHNVEAETQKLVDRLPANATVIAFDSAGLVLPMFGRHPVSFPRPMVFSPTDDARQADYLHFFDKRTPKVERQRIAARWHATHILFLAHESPPRLTRGLVQLGTVSAVGPWRIVTLNGGRPAEPPRALPDAHRWPPVR